MGADGTPTRQQTGCSRHDTGGCSRHASSEAPVRLTPGRATSRRLVRRGSQSQEFSRAHPPQYGQVVPAHPQQLRPSVRLRPPAVLTVHTRLTPLVVCAPGCAPWHTGRLCGEIAPPRLPLATHGDAPRLDYLIVADRKVEVLRKVRKRHPKYPVVCNLEQARLELRRRRRRRLERRRPQRRLVAPVADPLGLPPRVPQPHLPPRRAPEAPASAAQALLIVAPPWRGTKRGCVCPLCGPQRGSRVVCGVWCVVCGVWLCGTSRSPAPVRWLILSTSTMLSTEYAWPGICTPNGRAESWRS
eukprot:SAG11_NODE_261_length_11530_cov_8.418861_11_plen_300_part_00